MNINLGDVLFVAAYNIETDPIIDKGITKSIQARLVSILREQLSGMLDFKSDLSPKFYENIQKMQSGEIEGIVKVYETIQSILDTAQMGISSAIQKRLLSVAQKQLEHLKSISPEKPAEKRPSSVVEVDQSSPEVAFQEKSAKAAPPEREAKVRAESGSLVLFGKEPLPEGMQFITQDKYKIDAINAQWEKISGTHFKKQYVPFMVCTKGKEVVCVEVPSMLKKLNATPDEIRKRLHSKMDDLFLSAEDKELLKTILDTSVTPKLDEWIQGTLMQKLFESMLPRKEAFLARTRRLLRREISPLVLSSVMVISCESRNYNPKVHRVTAVYKELLEERMSLSSSALGLSLQKEREMAIVKINFEAVDKLIADWSLEDEHETLTVKDIQLIHFMLCRDLRYGLSLEERSAKMKSALEKLSQKGLVLTADLLEEWINNAPIKLSAGQKLALDKLSQEDPEIGSELAWLKDAPGVPRKKYMEVRFAGEGTQYILGEFVESELSVFEEWLEFKMKLCKGGAENPVVVAALAYQWLVSIHPFSDGNGRACRMVMDFILQKNRFPPATLQQCRVAVFAEMSDRDNPTQDQVIEIVRVGLSSSCKRLKLNPPFVKKA